MRNVHLRMGMLAGWLACLVVAAWAQEAPAANGTATVAATLRVSTLDEVKAEFDVVPCKNKERLQAVKALFERLGARPEDVTVADFKHVQNVVLSKPGTNNNAETIVIGAHYDKTADGCGAVDNWTGIVTLAHLYRTFKDYPLRKNVVFVAFGREEEGLIGSSAMTSKIKKEQATDYCAMINIDSLGIGVPQSLDNVSSPTLTKLTEALAKELELPFAHARIEKASSDSATFLQKKIPAITIHGLTSEWPNILHSKNDNPAKVNFSSVVAGYRLAAALLARVDEADCQAFREGKDKNKDKDKESKEKKESK